jgi:hypothetical protein
LAHARRVGGNITSERGHVGDLIAREHAPSRVQSRRGELAMLVLVLEGLITKGRIEVGPSTKNGDNGDLELVN